MKNPAASLYDDLARIDEALGPFSAPAIDEHAGLRWMRQTLHDRRDHISAKISEVERSSLTVTLSPANGTADAPSADVVATLLTALQQEVWVAAADLEWPDTWPVAQRDTATTLQVGAAGHDDDGTWTLELRRPAGPLGAQAVMPDGERLVFDAALDRLLDRLDDDRHHDLARVVVDHDLPLVLTFAGLDGEQRRVSLDQQRAQALLLTS